MVLTQPNEEVRNFLSAKRKEIQDAIKTLVSDQNATQVDIVTNIGCSLVITKQDTNNSTYSLLVELYNNHSEQQETHQFFTYDPAYEDSHDITDWCIAKLVDYLMRG